MPENQLLTAASSGTGKLSSEVSATLHATGAATLTDSEFEKHHTKLTDSPLLLFFGGQRKVTKETRPAIADSSLNRMVPVARAKTR